MQKIDFVNSINTVVDKLKSNEITSHFNTAFKNPSHNYPFEQINPLLFQSKSNYDQIKMDNRYLDILNSLEAESIYSEQNLASLTTMLHLQEPRQIFSRSIVVSLFNFHNTLVKTCKLAEQILYSKAISENLNSSGENGVVIFQVLIDGEGLETEKYIQILTALKELVDTINKVTDESNEDSEIVLLDSGSDTNIGIKSGIETAKSLFLIFKEIWDFIVHFRHYKQKQNNNSLLESLDIRTQIIQKIKEGVLTEAEGLEYIHIIKTRTDKLIGMKVLPKQIVSDSRTIENKSLLLEFENLKLLANSSDINNR